MKILHIISSGGIYGAEAVILNMSHTLNEGPHRSSIGVFSNSANPNLQLHEIALRQNIESSLIPCNGQLDRTVSSSIRQLVANIEADIIHAHGYKADIYAWFALRNLKIPLVSTCHTWYDNDLLVSLYGTADRRVLRNYAAVVAVSEEVKQRLLKSGVRAEKIHVVRNGIDLRPFDTASPSLRNELDLGQSQIVGLIGRLANEKGVDIFLRAAASVVEKLPSTKFVIVGEGPDRAKLEALRGQLNLQKSVFFTGRRDDMPSVYASLDLMVSSSRQEGLPIAILEGMASSLPLIATAVGEVPTVVINGRTGVLVPTEAPETLASEIIKLLQNTAQRDLLAASARQYIEQHYSAERMTTDYLRVYESARTTSESTETKPITSRGAAK